MITIAVCNEKGGVGKTTTTVSLGAAYARAGRRTLVIDLDPQASLTRGLIGSSWCDRLPPEATAAALFGDAVVPADRLVQATKFERLSLLPGSRRLKPINCLQPPEYGERQYALREFLNDLAGYDRVLIDNPPNLEFCSWASMTAADYVLCPTQAEDYGAQGVQFVARAVELVRAGVNPRLAMLGLVRTMFQKRSTVHLSFSEKLQADYPGILLENFIPHAAQFREAVTAQTPIGFYRPRCQAALACAAVVEEMEARIARFITNTEVA
jgi:chromosome partitioning protein